MQSQYKMYIQQSAVGFRYLPSQVEAFLQTKHSAKHFKFQNFASTCDSGTTESFRKQVRACIIQQIKLHIDF